MNHMYGPMTAPPPGYMPPHMAAAPMGMPGPMPPGMYGPPMGGPPPGWAPWAGTPYAHMPGMHGHAHPPAHEHMGDQQLGVAQTGGWWMALGMIALGVAATVLYLSPKREFQAASPGASEEWGQ